MSKRTRTRSTPAGICRGCKAEMEKPYWRPGGGWYCSLECKESSCPQRKAKKPGPRSGWNRGTPEHRVVRSHWKQDGPRYKLPEYKSYMNSAAWKRKRQEALVVAGNRCQDCGTSREKGLHVHHLRYTHFGNEPLEDLRVLCPDCHERSHKTGKRLLWKGARYRVVKDRPGGFRVVDTQRSGKVLLRTKVLVVANTFAQGADSA
jgi:5-methylcytosine-specific restriction endonuclease McrA